MVCCVSPSSSLSSTESMKMSLEVDIAIEPTCSAVTQQALAAVSFTRSRRRAHVAAARPWTAASHMRPCTSTAKKVQDVHCICPHYSCNTPPRGSHRFYVVFRIPHCSVICVCLPVLSTLSCRASPGCRHRGWRGPFKTPPQKGGPRLRSQAR